MGLQQSKDELLYEQAISGNIESIRALRREGAGLEWTDKEGKTPLAVACSSPELYNVAKALIELGADVNAYCPGHFGGTPLHHAAKRGLEQTVKLLLQHGANALVMNDHLQTPLDIARAKGYSNIVRAIEGHVCLFSGWLREIYGPGFLELLAPQLLSRRVWVVVLPCGSRNLRKPFRLELAMYSDAQDAQPRTIVPLWKANLEEPNFNQPDPEVIISDISRIPRRWKRRRGIKSSQEARSSRIKFVPANESETLQLQQFSNACKGIPQVMGPATPYDFPVPAAPPGAASPYNLPVPTAPTGVVSSPEDEETTMATNASIPLHERSSPRMDSSPVGASTSLAYSTNTSSHKESFISGAFTSHTANPSKIETQTATPLDNPPQTLEIPSVIQAPRENPSPAPIPSAPPAKDDGPVHYPSINAISDTEDERKDGSTASSCTICLDAPIEGACIPCGHMVACMMCVTEIHSKKWGCPVCRAHIDRVVRIYSA